MADLSRISRKMSLLLRHRPEAGELVLGRGGWVSLDALRRGLHLSGTKASREEILAVVATNDKQRFTLSPDGTRIRAAQGHSVEVDLELAPAVPPDRLWHGTATRVLDAIFDQGLRPFGRRHVHLSADPETARTVGARHGTPIVLEVDTARMARDGHLFYRADNGVWLTDRVAPGYLAFAPRTPAPADPVRPYYPPENQDDDHRPT